MKRLLTPILFGFSILLAAPALAQGIFDGLYGRPQQSGPQAPGRSADEPRQDTGLPVITNRPRSGTTGAPGLPGRLERPLSGEAESLEQIRQLQRPERERNEFQEFVLQSTGRDLPLFGHDLFRGVPSTFSPLENVPVTPDYLIGPGDVIYFPPIGPLAAVSRSINVAAVYELKPGASLGELIRWAGGLATTAEGQRVVVERIENRRARKVEEFSLDATGLARTVRDGDLVTVRALVPRFENAVTLRGNVAQPGRFPWREGMRVRDLIPEKEALLSREYLLRQNQLVGLDENITRRIDDEAVSETIRRRQIERDALQVAVPESGRGVRPG